MITSTMPVSAVTRGQGTREWREDRLGCVTASRFGDVLSDGKATKTVWRDEVLGDDTTASEQELQRSHLAGDLQAKVESLKVGEITKLIETHFPAAEFEGTKAVRAERFANAWPTKGVKLLPPPPLTIDDLGKSAETYLFDLIGESLTFCPCDGFESEATRWGKQHEAIARQAYERETGWTVEEMPFCPHPNESRVGCSPDGEPDSGLVRIKCPFTTKEHVRTLVTGEMPVVHKPQVQGEMWVRNKPWSDFVSFDPRMPLNSLKLVIIRVERDDDYIRTLANKVCRFRDLLVSTLSDIRTANGSPF